jgi:carboxyl-terminal processing protease
MRLRFSLLPVLLAALVSAQTGGFTTTQSMLLETRATAALLEKLHISKKDMGSIDMNSVVRTYCENLDGAKMYFTAEEVDEFVTRYGKTLDLYLQRGNLTPAFEIFALFKKRVAERTAANLAALDQPTGTEVEIVPLVHAVAADLAQALHHALLGPSGPAVKDPHG